MSSTIDAAIIKALVEHIGGNPDSIPDGSIGGGKTYTEGDGINIVNDTISVEYDTNTMELKNGKLAAKACDAGIITSGSKVTMFRFFKVVGTTLGIQSGMESNDFAILKYKTYDGDFCKLMLVTKATDKLTFISKTNATFEFTKVTDSTNEFYNYFTYTFDNNTGVTPAEDQTEAIVYSNIFNNPPTNKTYVIPQDDMLLLIFTILKRQEIGQRLHYCS